MLSQPDKIVFEPTNACNLKCIKCGRAHGLKGRKKGFLKLSDLEKMLAKLPASIQYIGLNGFGEPLMHPQFIQMLEVIHACNSLINMGFHTNGHLMTPDITDAILKYNVKDIQISIDAIDDKTYGILHATSESNFQKVIDNVRYLIDRRNLEESKLRIGLAYVMQQENLGQLAGFIEMAYSMGVDFVGPVVPVSPYVGYNFDSWKEPYKDMRNDIADAKKVRDRLGMEVQFPNLDRGKPGSANIEPIKAFACSFPYVLYPIITWDGYAMPCVWIQDLKYNTGNLVKEEFGTIWNGDPIRKIRKLFALQNYMDVCRNCRPGNFEY